ncbi:MAG TPA: TolC family protein [Polyangiaceae bacterium]|nr:TolC family protein [Polyangiaceae bacterium]
MDRVKMSAPWRRLVWGVLLLLPVTRPLTSTVRAEAPSPLSLEQAVERARKRHPQIAQARAELEAQQAVALRARSGYLPGITARISYEPQTANFAPTPTYARALVRRFPQGVATVVDSGGQAVTVQCIPPLNSNGDPSYSAACRRNPNGINAKSYGLTNFWTASFGVVWTAFDWGQTTYAHRAATIGVHARELSIRAAEVDATLSVKLAYYAVLAAQAGLTVAEEAVATQTHHLDQARTLLERGLKTRADVAFAESDLANAELTMAEAQGGLATAWSDLYAAMGESERHPYQLVTAMPADEQVTPAEDLEHAIAQHPETESLSLLAKSYREQSRAQRGQYLPRLVLSFGPNFIGPAPNAMVTNFGGSIALVYPGSSLNGTGMNPWAVKADIHEAAALARLTEARKAQVAMDLRQLGERTQSEILAAQAAARAARRRVEAAQERRNLVQGQYAAGVASMLELSDAELAFIDAQFREVSARLQLCQARATLDRVYGRSH